MRYKASRLFSAVHNLGTDVGNLAFRLLTLANFLVSPDAEAL